jgi:MobA-like NTP transferase domain
VRIFIAASRLYDARWPESQGTPKQLVDIGGERLIERSIRQFSAHGELSVVYGAAPLPVEAHQVRAENDPRLGDINGIINARRHWSKTDRTLIVLGDVWFTDDAVAKIVAPRSDWCLYGRPRGSDLTGKRWDEQFAVGFEPAEQDRVYAAAARGATMVRHHQIRWCRFPQWFHCMHGLTDRRRIDRVPDISLGHFVVIDDATDDIDKPDDYRRLRERIHAA